MVKAASIVNDLIRQGEFRLRVTLAKLFNDQRASLPIGMIVKNGQVPVDATSQWQNDFAEWYLDRALFWQNIFVRSVRRIQERKQTAQQFYDAEIAARAEVIGLQLAAVNAAVIDEVLIQHATGSVTRLNFALRQSIGLRPDQFSAFTNQAAIIDKKFSAERARILKDRLYNQKLNFRAQLIARTEISTAVNTAQVSDIEARISRGDLPGDMEKKWSTIGDDVVSELCQINEDEGWLALQTQFPSGHERPPRFPGCRCGLQFRSAQEALVA